MRAARIALTQDDVDGLTTDKPDAWVYFKQEGLCIRLRRGDGGEISKTWYVAYQDNGKAAKHRLGATADYSAEAAQSEAWGIRRHGPPDRAEPVKTKRLSMGDAAIEFIRRREGTVRPNTSRGYPRYLTGPYFKSLHNIELARITVGQIAACLDHIQDVGVFDKPSKSAAKHARTALCMLYDFAQTRGWVDPGFNPARATEDPLPKEQMQPRERALSDRELVIVWNGAGDDDFGRIVRLAILLGNRREEIGGMKWSELHDGTWHLPAERNKIGHARKIPLSAAALAIIGERPEGRTYVFGSQDKGFSNWSKGFRRLDERLLGLDAPFRLHDLRRTMRTGLSRIPGLDLEVKELMIGHIPPKSIRTYDTLDRLADQARGFALWAEYVEGVISGKVSSICRDAA